MCGFLYFTEGMFLNPILRNFILYAYIALVATLSLLPSSSLPSDKYLYDIHFDKWVHLMMYFGVWTLWVWAYKGVGLLVENRSKRFITAFGIVFLIGTALELLQEITGRSHIDWWDVLANMAGAVLAWRMWLKFEKCW